jgi:hypothetical protein
MAKPGGMDLSALISGATSALPAFAKGAEKNIPAEGVTIDPDEIPDAPTFSDKVKQWALSMTIKLIFFIGKVISWLNDRKYMVFFVYSLYLGLKWYLNDQEAKALAKDYNDYNIQGRYIDSINHQLNIFDWKSSTTIVRKQQGLATTETWTFDHVKKRFIVSGAANSSTANYASLDAATRNIKVFTPSGLLLYTLRSLPYTSTTCAACANADKERPTYSNFKTKYILAKVRTADQLSFANELDTIRVCATYNIANILVGPQSNLNIAAGPIAIAVDGSCFFTVPSTNYTMLLSNQVQEQEVSLVNVPTSFCGSM